MQRWFSYRTSDFDLSAHRGDIQLDLQQIDLPDASVDVILTPHVLEHVPDTDRALSELFRVIAPGGRMYLQVPLSRGQTAAPTTPEFHDDNTPVFWNFGWDLTDRRASGGVHHDRAGHRRVRRRAARRAVQRRRPRAAGSTSVTLLRARTDRRPDSGRRRPTWPGAWDSSRAISSPPGSACGPDGRHSRRAKPGSVDSGPPVHRAR